VRTTLTLDDDVAAKIKAETRRSGKPFKQIINELLRVALNAGARKGRISRFEVVARDLGRLKPSHSLDNVGELLEQAEGPWRR
jgi:hypothetical protein